MYAKHGLTTQTIDNLRSLSDKRHFLSDDDFLQNKKELQL